MNSDREPAPPYRADDQHYMHSRSQEYKYEQGPFEQRGSRAPEEHYDGPSSQGLHDDSLTSDQTYLSQALEFTRNIVPITSRIRKLESPIAIPQTSPGLGKSFLRAWAPILQYHNLSASDLVSFIDNLNVVSTSSPPLQILDLAGGAVGMVPHHWAQLAGLALQGTAKIGIAMVSKGRTEMYMREVNERIFKPRGLKVNIVSTEAMRAILRIPADQIALAPLIGQTMTMSLFQRVLMAVGPYNAVLDFDVPPLGEQATMLAKLSARQVASREKSDQKKLLKDREKVAKKGDERLENDERKRGKRQEKDEKKREKRRGKDEKRKHGKSKERRDYDSVSDSDLDEDRGTKASRGHHSGKEHKESKKDKEEKNAGKLLWIMIESWEI